MTSRYHLDDRIVLAVVDPPRSIKPPFLRRRVRYVRGTVVGIKKLGSNWLLDIIDDENCRRLINEAQVEPLNPLEWLTEL